MHREISRSQTYKNYNMRIWSQISMAQYIRVTQQKSLTCFFPTSLDGARVSHAFLFSDYFFHSFPLRKTNRFSTALEMKRVSIEKCQGSSLTHE